MEFEILRHALEAGDKECCGFVINDNKYIPCQNIALDPFNNFEISDDDYIKTSEQGKITAIVHSHPNGKKIMSEADFFHQRLSGIDWWIVKDHYIYKYRNIAPLLGREFKHGIFDCYTIVRDVYHISGLDLPNFERNDEWWNNGCDLYLDNMEKNNFKRVKSAQLGDIILFKLNSKVANHAAIYVDKQMILHHSDRRLSKRDLFDGYWLNHFDSIWRYEKWQSLDFTAILNNMEASSK